MKRIHGAFTGEKVLLSFDIGSMMVIWPRCMISLFSRCSYSRTAARTGRPARIYIIAPLTKLASLFSRLYRCGLFGLIVDVQVVDVRCSVLSFLSFDRYISVHVCV